MQNFSYENVLDLDEFETVGGKNFFTNGFARRLVLTQRKMITRNALLLFASRYYYNLPAALFSD